MRYVLLALALTIGLVSASPPNDDADTQRVARFGINAHFFNQLKKQKDKQSGKMHCKILLAFNQKPFIFPNSKLNELNIFDMLFQSFWFFFRIV